MTIGFAPVDIQAPKETDGELRGVSCPANELGSAYEINSVSVVDEGINRYYYTKNCIFVGVKMTQLTYTNIFDAITEDQGLAAEMQFRSDLMIVLRKIFEAQGWTQKDIGEVLGVPQPRVSEIVNGKVDKVSSDKLISYLAKLGFRFKPTAGDDGEGVGPVVRCSVTKTAA
ncbi:helix-turn-helix domain-containing protein [Marinobacter nauticus]|uniref:helix-turn-helix domain-containing protein n=1 Tax=Marinobacter nauticus TaxID=2743 RepID=UPI004044508D